MKKGDTVYVRYIGNIRHWNRALFQAPITGIGVKYVTLAINGQLSRFERTTLRHDNQGHSPSYQLYLTVEAYEQEAERAELLSLMNRTDFACLPVAKQRAIRSILEAQ